MAIESILPDGYKTAELIEADGIIRIDIDKPYRQTYLNLSAYFNGRQNDSMSLKKFQFYENDAPKNLTNCTITIHAQKPDGKTVVADLEIWTYPDSVEVLYTASSCLFYLFVIIQWFYCH